jgi:hypothetical protein
MIDCDLIDDLAAMPSSQWNAMISRREALEAYLSITNPTTDEVDCFAARAGMSRRNFYRLIRRRRDQLAGRKRIGKPRLGSPISPARSRLIFEAIATVPAGAPIKDVVERVEALAALHELQPPSAFTVAEHMHAGDRYARLKAIVEPGVRYVVDATSTDLSVDTGGGSAYHPYLLVIIDCERECVAAHALCAALEGNVPVRLLSDFVTRPDGGNEGVVVTKRAAPLLRTMANASVSPIITDRLRSGEAIKVVLGKALGRIALLSRDIHLSPPDAINAIKFEVAEMVINRLLDDHR